MVVVCKAKAGARRPWAVDPTWSETRAIRETCNHEQMAAIRHHGATKAMGLADRTYSTAFPKATHPASRAARRETESRRQVID